MIGHGAKFGRKQEEAIAALLTQRNVDEAARSIGIDPKTLLRWMKVPEFKTAYREARRATFSQMVARLQQGSPAAATKLLKIMVDQNAPYASRVRAAECVMNQTMKAIEVEDIEVRVSELDQAAQLSKSGGKSGPHWLRRLENVGWSRTPHAFANR